MMTACWHLEYRSEINCQKENKDLNNEQCLWITMENIQCNEDFIDLKVDIRLFKLFKIHSFISDFLL